MLLKNGLSATEKIRDIFWGGNHARIPLQLLKTDDSSAAVSRSLTAGGVSLILRVEQS